MSTLRKNLLMLVGVLLLLALLGYGVSKMLSGKSSKAYKPPRISLLPASPPPRPPPPKEVKKPEPPKEQKEVKIDRVAAPAPASQDLKMDGPAGDGPSAFGAGKITNDDLSKVGKSDGGPVASGMFSPFNNYASLLKGELQRSLARNKDLRQRAYRVELRLWVGRDGSVTRHELVGSTGDPDVDEIIRQALGTMGSFTQVPPEGMPQPIRLRLVTGGR